MNNKGKQAYDLLEKISFVRISGSEEELKAANILKEEIKKLKLDVKLEEFEVPFYHPIEVKFKVTKPYEKEYNATIIGHSGNINAEKDFVFVENFEQLEYLNVKDKIVMLNQHVSYKAYKMLTEAGSAGFVTFSGLVQDEEDKTDIAVRILRKGHTKYGECPGATIRVRDAIEIVDRKAEKVLFVVNQESTTATSRNIITEEKGITNPEEVILLCGHVDSDEYSKGSYDNGAGSVIIMEILKHFAKNPPKRTVRFAWFGSEERGLLGSNAYISEHEKELENIKIVINVDVAGPTLGQDVAFVSADLTLKHMIDLMGKETGFSIESKHDIYSSDSTPFAEKGVPAVSFCRFGARGSANIHNRYDTMDIIRAESLDRTISFVETFSERLANAVHFPIPRKIPENIKKLVDKYMSRNRGELPKDDAEKDK